MTDIEYKLQATQILFADNIHLLNPARYDN